MVNACGTGFLESQLPERAVIFSTYSALVASLGDPDKAGIFGSIFDWCGAENFEGSLFFG